MAGIKVVLASPSVLVQIRLVFFVPGIVWLSKFA